MYDTEPRDRVGPMAPAKIVGAPTKTIWPITFKSHIPKNSLHVIAGEKPAIDESGQEIEDLVILAFCHNCIKRLDMEKCLQKFASDKAFTAV